MFSQVRTVTFAEAVARCSAAATAELPAAPSAQSQLMFVLSWRSLFPFGT